MSKTKFKKDNYLLVKNFISKEMATYFYEYAKLSASRLKWLVQNVPDSKPGNIMGKFWDDTKSYDCYGDMAFDTLLAHKLPDLEDLTGKQLVPTYSYYRLYTTGSELKKHIDRMSCEISISMCLGYDNSNLHSSGKKYNWPLIVEGKPLYMEPGDMVVYRGCMLEHWREPFKGVEHAQVFMHYNDKNSDLDNLNDERPALGLPVDFKGLR